MLKNKKLVTWKKAYSVGIKEIDKEHKELIKIMNRLYTAILENREHEELGYLLQDIIKYTDYHFTVEEKYFELFNYKDKASHIREHRFFLKKIDQFQQDHKKKKKDLGLDVIDFLEDWFLDHILTTDKKYMACFHKHGLK